MKKVFVKYCCVYIPDTTYKNKWKFNATFLWKYELFWEVIEKHNDYAFIARIQFYCM